MEFQLSYFKSWKMMLRKCSPQYSSKFGKLSSGHRAGKGQFFIPIPKKGHAKECSNYVTIALISHASKVMLKILQARLKQYMNHELPDVQTGFRKGRGTKDQISNIHWIIEKAGEFQKTIYFCFMDYAKHFDCVDHNKLWEILQEMGIPDHLTCLLSDVYAVQEGTVRTGHWNNRLVPNRERNTSVQFSHSVLSDSLQLHGPQQARPPCPSPTPGVYSNSCPLSWWCCPDISSSSPPALNLSQQQGLFKRVSSSRQVAKVLEFQLQHQSFQWIFRTGFL